jgi:hypothetical protein
MRVAVLGATGGTGRQLVSQALQRGHQVDALVRDPALAAEALPAHPLLTLRRADVHDPASIASAISPESAVVSGLGVKSRKEAGTLTAGARAVIAARPARIVWLGAIGTGPSTAAVGRLTARLLRAGFGPEFQDKVDADGSVLEAGGTVVHSGPLSDKADDLSTRALPLSAARRRFFPRSTPRASIARLMLDEAERSKYPGEIIVPSP